MTWQVGPNVLTCQLTGRWHGTLTVHDDVTLTSCWRHPGMPTVHADVTITSWWRHHYPGLSHGSGQLVFGSDQPIWAKKTRGTRGPPPRRRVGARAATSDVRFRRCFHQWLRLFLLYTVVWSKHNFDNFHFWAKIKHHFKPCALIPIVGDSGTPFADQWYIDSCS